MNAGASASFEAVPHGRHLCCQLPVSDSDSWKIVGVVGLKVPRAAATVFRLLFLGVNPSASPRYGDVSDCAVLTAAIAQTAAGPECGGGLLEAGAGTSVLKAVAMDDPSLEGSGVDKHKGKSN
jgi:hypothetical protein